MTSCETADFSSSSVDITTCPAIPPGFIDGDCMLNSASVRGALAAWLLSSLTAPVFAQRDLKEIPDPNPELERATFVVPEGFEVNLFAGDPLIAKPIHMNFDAQGRLWIASSEVYPQISPGKPATDKILMLEDVNGDGVAVCSPIDSISNDHLAFAVVTLAF